ncbi:MAG: ATP-binding cassette domain-containing protein [Eubacterium sp.]|nr:ATP-binding cassette domain-containing protein [Eubacterium sp.]
MIEVEGLTKVYGENKAVSDLSLSIEKGKIYGLLGENGAGKSTTMNIITGYIGATAGTVKVGDYDIVKNPVKAKQHIGYLPEIPPVYNDMRVIEYLRFVAELKKVPRAERKAEVQRVMELTGLVDMQKRLIANLSKGYKQRVGLAAAITGSPDVIILDEPTVGLDPVQIIEIRKLIKDLSKEHAVILSSHILSEVSEICDHIFIISKGKLVASDNTQSLLHMESDGDVRKLKCTFIGTIDRVNSLLDDIPGIDAFKIIASRGGADKKDSDADASNSEDSDESANEKTDVLATDGGKSSEPQVDVEITTPHNNDIRKTLFYAAAEKRLPIIAMAENIESLEDVFIHMTGRDTESASSPSEEIEKAVDAALSDEDTDDSEESNTVNLSKDSDTDSKETAKRGSMINKIKKIKDSDASDDDQTDTLTSDGKESD